MNIVCGDTLGISCGTWVAFWNGSIGAFFAAVIGGLVALAVVRLTNAQNARQAEKSRQIAAVAELITSLERVMMDIDGAQEDQVRPFLTINAAWVKLKMSGHDAAELAEVMRRWPQFVSLLVTNPPPAGKGAVDEYGKFKAQVRSAVAVATVNLPDWTHGDSEIRRTIVHKVLASEDVLRDLVQTKVFNR